MCLNFSFLWMLTYEIMKSKCGNKQSRNTPLTFYQSFEKKCENKDGGNIKHNDETILPVEEKRW